MPIIVTTETLLSVMLQAAEYVPEGLRSQIDEIVAHIADEGCQLGVLPTDTKITVTRIVPSGIESRQAN